MIQSRPRANQYFVNRTGSRMRRLVRFFYSPFYGEGVEYVSWRWESNCWKWDSMREQRMSLEMFIEWCDRPASKDEIAEAMNLQMLGVP